MYKMNASKKHLKHSNKKTTKKLHHAKINSLIKPLIFSNPLKDQILFHNMAITPPEYISICQKLFESKNGKKYRAMSNAILHDAIKHSENIILYMNFKSHNILDDSKREKLYDMIKLHNPNIICLSEALLPTSIDNNKNLKEKHSAMIVDIKSLTDDTISQPYEACKKFTEKKMAEYNGIKSIKNKWQNFFLEHGYNYIVFANPTECPWGSNWGNCIITKTRPLDAYVLQMGSYGKEAFEVPESRSAVCIKINESNHEYICSTQLDNNNSNARIHQVKELIQFIKKLKSKSKSKIKNVTLLGDLNAINIKSYTKTELKILGLLNLDKKPLQTDAIDILNKSNILGKRPINTGQTYEGFAQKCITHVYSTKYKHNIMIFTDATDFDHQPIFIW